MTHEPPVHGRPTTRRSPPNSTDDVVAPERVLARVAAMLDSGAIRRIGAVPNHYRLGWIANGMSVWDVDDAVVDEVGEVVGALACVSHCYRRPRRLPRWPYNLFALLYRPCIAHTDNYHRLAMDVLWQEWCWRCNTQHGQNPQFIGCICGELPVEFQYLARIFKRIEN